VQNLVISNAMKMPYQETGKSSQYQLIILAQFTDPSQPHLGKFRIIAEKKPYFTDFIDLINNRKKTFPCKESCTGSNRNPADEHPGCAQRTALGTTTNI
jgi:hypothetical protein